MTAQIYAVHHDQVTAAQALAWFCEPADDHTVIGYTLAPDRAEWFRCQGVTPHGPRNARNLTGVFELFATSGRRQLRWVQQAGGRGRAIALAEDAGLLPDGTAVRTKQVPDRLEGVATRLLAGLVTEAHDGWATLASARYTSYEVPVAAKEDQEVWAEQAEYVVRDHHGNLSVTDTLLLGLHSQNRKGLRSTRAATE